MPVTLKDIAREVGVSVTTASRALAGYDDVAQETKERVRQAAGTLGYVPNPLARRLQKRKTDTLGFIMPTAQPRFSDPFFTEFIAGIGNEAAKHHYDLLVSTHPPDSEAEYQAYLRAVNGGWVDGLLVTRTRVDDWRIQLLCDHGFPFVAFGRAESPHDFPYVDEDGVAGMRLLVQHFANLGHQRIAFVSPPENLMFGRFRRQGYLEGMAENDLPVDPDWIIAGNMTQRGGAAVVMDLIALDSPPTAIIAGNDLMAIGAMKQIEKRGLQVGRNIAVAGFDNIPMAAYVSPSLTTVHQPIHDIGRMICDMLVDLLGDRPLRDAHVLLTPELVVRESSGSAVAEEKGGARPATN